MMKQNTYREWFWSHLSAESSDSNLDLLDGPNPFLKEPPSLTAYPNNSLDQVTHYLREIEEVVAQVRLEEQARQIELVRGAASMYILQGDIKGAEVCQNIENLLITTNLP